MTESTLGHSAETDTGSAAPPSPPHPPLRRTRGDDKIIAGVAGGIARSLAIDPILVRVAFVLLAIFGGSGGLLYLAGWLFIPAEDETETAGTRFMRDKHPLIVAGAVVLAVLLIGPLFAWGMWDGRLGFGGTVLMLLVVAAAVALARRGAATPTAPPSAAQLPSGDASPTALVPGPVPAPVPAPAPAPPKEKSVLGRLTLGVALLVAGLLVALDLAGAIAVDAVTVLSSALAVVAIGLLVGAFVGRARGLIALGVVMTIVLIPVSAIPDGLRWNTGAGTGDRTYEVHSWADLRSEYALGAGSLTLDLRDLRAEQPTGGAAATTTPPTSVTASVGAGEVVVLLPRGDRLPVSVTAEVGVGNIDLPGGPGHGDLGAESSWQTPTSTASDPPVLHLDLSSGVGRVTVVSNAAAQIGGQR